jgi:hypothetical protein
VAREETSPRIFGIAFRRDPHRQAGAGAQRHAHDRPDFCVRRERDGEAINQGRRRNRRLLQRKNRRTIERFAYLPFGGDAVADGSFYRCLARFRVAARPRQITGGAPGRAIV